MGKLGGAREGAGRKPGTANKKTRAIRAKAFSDGITPLEVLLQAMRKHYDDGDLDGAAGFAKDAAPYMHPRLHAADTTIKGELAVTVETVRFSDAQPLDEDDPL